MRKPAVGVLSSLSNQGPWFFRCRWPSTHELGPLRDASRLAEQAMSAPARSGLSRSTSQFPPVQSTRNRVRLGGALENSRAEKQCGLARERRSCPSRGNRTGAPLRAPVLSFRIGLRLVPGPSLALAACRPVVLRASALPALPCSVATVGRRARDGHRGRGSNDEEGRSHQGDDGLLRPQHRCRGCVSTVTPEHHNYHLPSARRGLVGAVGLSPQSKQRKLAGSCHSTPQRAMPLRPGVSPRRGRAGENFPACPGEP